VISRFDSNSLRLGLLLLDFEQLSGIYPRDSGRTQSFPPRDLELCAQTLEL